MTLYQTLKNELLEARKAKDKTKLGIIQVVMGEADTATDGVGNCEDGMMINILKKVENANSLVLEEMETKKDELDEGQKDRYEILVLENLFLNQFIPPDLTEEEVREILTADESISGAQSMGAAIGLAVNKLKNQPVDNATVAKIARELWSEARE